MHGLSMSWRGPTRLAWVASLLAICLMSVQPARAGHHAPESAESPPAQPSVSIDRAATSATATIHPRQTASFGALLLAAMFLLLYAYRRRAFILQWTSGWLLLAIAMSILSRDDPTRLGMAAAGLLSVASAFTFYRAGANVRGVMFNTPLFRFLLAGTMLWYAVARIFLSRPQASSAGFAMLAMMLALAAYQYFRLVRERRLLGAGVIAVMLLFIAGANVLVAGAVGGFVEDGRVTLSVIVFNSVSYIVAAFGMFVLVFEDITGELRETNRVLEAARDELRHLSMTDPLTGAYNRRYLEETFPRELQRHKRYNIPLSLLFVDVDHFKGINDRLGHEVGDRVLQHVAAFLARNVREGDYVFRWGGDEFLILISCGLQEAERKALELKQTFKRSLEPHDLPRTVGLSVGCTDVRPDATDLAPLVRLADQRMYVDKSVGSPNG